MNVKCEICGLIMKSRVNGSHLKRVHDIFLKEYIESFPYSEIGKRNPQVKKYNCKICGLLCKGSSSLSSHVKKHNLYLDKYYINYYLNKKTPMCKCGCGKIPSFKNMEIGFHQYIVHHNPVWNVGLTRENDERVNELYKKRKVWNKGLTKKNNEKVFEISKKISLNRQTWSYDKMIDSYEKSMKNRLLWKEYKLPSGKIVLLQGYEPQALNLLLSIYNENELCVEKRKVPKFTYIFKKKKRKFFPDFYIIKENKIVEVKSDYTYKENLQQNLAKKKEVLKNNYLFEFWIMDRVGNLLYKK